MFDATQRYRALEGWRESHFLDVFVEDRID